MNILVTGATGNIGVPLINVLVANKAAGASVIAGARDASRASRIFTGLENLTYRKFDFEDPSTFKDACTDIDIVFLLRPPHISNIRKYFKPFFDAMKERGVKKVVFLSVQGAETSDIIPHRKIEKMILAYGFEYIFSRPGYFMQNLTTTLLEDIKKTRSIILPAGDAKFNWIDIENIAEVCAEYLVDFEKYKNRAYVLTGNENRSFSDIVDKINDVAHAEITYRSVNPLRYIIIKMKDHAPLGMILVMTMLHFLPRFQDEPAKSSTYVDMFGEEPGTLERFLEKNKDLFL